MVGQAADNTDNAGENSSLPDFGWMQLLSTRISILDPQKAIQIMTRWIADRRGGYVCVADVHSVMKAETDVNHRLALSRARMVTPDGAPIVFVARMNGIFNIKRVTGPDLMLEMCSKAQVFGWRSYFYGGAESVVSTLRDKLIHRFPNLQVCGVYSPPFRDLSRVEEVQAVDAIREAGPDIVWVGLGCPKQEAWMHRNEELLPGVLLIGVGAAFDIWSGNVARAPSIMRRLGLEWSYRLLVEPRRLWRRYLVLAPKFLLLSFIASVKRSVVRT